MECEAGMRKNFTAAFKANDMFSSVADTLHSQMLEVVPKQEFFLPSDALVSDISILLDENDETLSQEDWEAKLLQTGAICEEGGDGGCSVEFGGKAHMKFGCKMTFKKEDDGKITKKVECGIKGVARGGKADGEKDESPFEFVMPKVLD